MDRPHPWQSSYDEFHDKTLPKLKEHGKAIGADTGETALKIQEAYGMLLRSFDPVQHMLLQDRLAAWLKERGLEEGQPVRQVQG
jgi:hypothetical protein